jgi:hypothetical protein
VPAPTSIVINEILYDPEGSDTGLEAIELYNPSAVPADLGGYSLHAGAAGYYTIPPFILDPAAFVVVHVNAVGSDTPTDLYTGPMNGNMSNTAASVALFYTTTHTAETLADFVQYGASGQTWESAAVLAGLWLTDDFALDVDEGDSLNLQPDGNDQNQGDDWQACVPTQAQPNCRGQAQDELRVYLPLVLCEGSFAIADAPDACPGLSISTGQTYGDDFDHANDNDWFTFQATAGLSYTIQTGDLQANSDTIMALYAADCATQLAENDDVSYPSNVASQILWLASASGPLRVMVRNYDWNIYGANTGYSLGVYENLPAPVDDAPDACPGQPIVTGQSYDEDFDRANDNDWFTFDVTAGQTYTITTGDLQANADTIMTLYAADCATQLAENDDISYPDNVASQIVWQASSDGQLHAMIRNYDWSIHGADTGYTVIVKE